MVRTSIFLSIAIAVCCGSVHAADPCGELTTHFGPFDYRDPAHASDLKMVEQHHFTHEVEMLIKGATGPIGGDLAYTLYAFPNHTRALSTIARLSVKTKSAYVNGTKMSVECFFKRGIRFKPDDAGVRSLYGSYLYQLGQTDAAFDQFSEAVRLAPTNASMNYNLGLVYFEKKDYHNALLFAQKAYAAGYPLLGLKNKLRAIGKWDASVPN